MPVTDGQLKLSHALLHSINMAYIDKAAVSMEELLAVLAHMAAGYIAEDPATLRSVFIAELDRAIVEHRIHPVS